MFGSSQLCKCPNRDTTIAHFVNRCLFGLFITVWHAGFARWAIYLCGISRPPIEFVDGNITQRVSPIAARSLKMSCHRMILALGRYIVKIKLAAPDRIELSLSGS